MHTCLMVVLLVVFVGPITAQVPFTKITQGPHVNDGGASRSVNWIDYDGDGFLDLFVSNSSGPAGRKDFLYHNNGPDSGFTFRKITTDPITLDNGRSDGASFADYDNDGDLDGMVVNWYNENNMLYRNIGYPTYSFEKITTGAPVTDGGLSETCSWGDYNNDGFLDLYVTNSGNSGLARTNFLYRNEGNGTFSKITSGGLVTDVEFSRGANWVDYDHDGDQDLFIANEENQNNSLYRNMLVEAGVDTFSKLSGDVLVSDGGNSMSSSWGDVDNDGDLDVFIGNGYPASQNNWLYLQNVDHSFLKWTEGPIVNDGGYTFCTGWGDMDNDGDLDLYVVNAYGPTASVNFLYRNMLTETGTLAFTKVTEGPPVTETGDSFGFAWGDYDLDGDLDIFVAKTASENENNSLFRNDNSNGYHWAEFRCVGLQSNRSGIGARLSVKTTINGLPTWQTRIIEGQAGYCGQNLWAHFGLQLSSTIDSLVVEWPSGITTVHSNIEGNRRITIQEDGTISDVTEGRHSSTRFALRPNFPNPFNPTTTLQFDIPKPSHVELSIYDILGRLVETITNQPYSRGLHSLQWNAGNHASGMYICMLRTNSGTASRRILLLK